MTKNRVGKVERRASVSELRAKAKAKVAKAKGKVAAKCKRCAEAVAVLLCVGALAAGCLEPSAPSRSQTITFDRSTINIYGCGDAGTQTNEVARVELATQAMAIETGGNESQTQTPTLDVSPKTDLSLEGGGSGTAGAVKSVASAAEAAVECVGGNCGE